MEIGLLKRVLLWCAVFNSCFLLLWFLMFACARDWIYRMHSRWFRISEERFDSIHYRGMTVYKMAVFALNIVPLLAILAAT